MKELEALKLVFEALKAMMQEFRGYDLPYGSKAYVLAKDACLFAEDALAQPEQEPVAWLKTWNSAGHAQTGMQRVDLTPECETWLANMFPTITPLYTTPPQRTWVGLTDVERDLLRSGYQSGRIGSFVELCRAIEAKLKEKNT